MLRARGGGEPVCNVGCHPEPAGPIYYHGLFLYLLYCILRFHSVISELVHARCQLPESRCDIQGSTIRIAVRSAAVLCMGGTIEGSFKGSGFFYTTLQGCKTGFARVLDVLY